jgi:hypothetical protein
MVRTSTSQLPSEPQFAAGRPVATRLWVRGFLAGFVPQLDDDTYLETRQRQADVFLTTGTWPDQ